MRIALYHGWELEGSGSNEYTRYLSRAFAELGHEVHVLCREENPEAIEHACAAWEWTPSGDARDLYRRESPVAGRVTVHVLPHHPAFRPVFVTDKQRAGNVKTFHQLTDQELDEYLSMSRTVVAAILDAHPVDVLLANHTLPQPQVAVPPCRERGIPVFVFPHGSAIEYTLRRDERCRALALEALQAATGVVVGSHEMERRLDDLFDGSTWRNGPLEVIGVGVDTCRFHSVARSERPLAVQRLMEELATRHGGRPPELTHELETAFARHDLDGLRTFRDRYDRSKPDADAARRLERLDFANARFLVFVGSLTAGKGLQSLITALPSVLASREDVHLLVVGSGSYREVLEALVYGISTADLDLLRELARRGNDLDDTHLEGSWEDVVHHLAQAEHRAVIERHGRALREHVHFLGRFSHDLLQHLYPCADLAIYPSTVKEAYPLVLLESYASGVLPMATWDAGFREGLELLRGTIDEETLQCLGIPCDPTQRVTELAGRIETLLETARDRSHGAALRAFAVEQCDWIERAKRWITCFYTQTSAKPPVVERVC